MGTCEYISENEAAAIAGVSVKTLKQFIEAGYLKPEADGDGLQLISKDEVRALFGVGEMEVTLNQIDNPSLESSLATQESGRPLPAEPSNPTASTTARSLVGNELTQKEALTSTSPVSSGPTIAIPAPSLPLREQFKTLTRPNLEGTTTPGTAILERELDKVRSINEMQLKLLDLRETEIERLQSERDWLRRRIERLEEQNQRNQVILLTETQMIGQIMASREERKGPVKTLLGWIGLASNQPTPGTNYRSHPSQNQAYNNEGNQSDYAREAPTGSRSNVVEMPSARDPELKKAV